MFHGTHIQIPQERGQDLVQWESSNYTCEVLPRLGQETLQVGYAIIARKPIYTTSSWHSKYHRSHITSQKVIQYSLHQVPDSESSQTLRQSPRILSIE